MLARECSELVREICVGLGVPFFCLTWPYNSLRVVDGPEYVGLKKSCADLGMTFRDQEGRLLSQENHVPSSVPGLADAETRPPASFTTLQMDGMFCCCCCCCLIQAFSAHCTAMVCRIGDDNRPRRNGGRPGETFLTITGSPPMHKTTGTHPSSQRRP